MKNASKIVIVGASTAGVSVATRLRRLDENAEIVLLDRSDVISYATCAIPYYLGGIIKEESRLQINSREDLSRLYNIDVRTQAEVFSIKRDNKAIIIRDLESGTVYEESYQKLVLAPGAVANKYNFDGRFADHIFTANTRHDGIAIKQFLDNTDIQRALVVGAGLNALEIAEHLHRLGITVTLVDESNKILTEWDVEMSSLVQRRLWDKKIRFIHNERIDAVDKESVSLTSGKSLKADIIIIATGLSPNVLLAEESGLDIGSRGGIKVNNGLLTSDDNIYALGDAVELYSHRMDSGMSLPFASAAYKQGRIVAENLCGKYVSYIEPPRNIVVKIFDMTVAIAGASEAQLIKANINYHKSYSESLSLARYYPNARSMIIKLLFASNTGCILGAQIVGGSGVDKRIDIIATAMQMGQSVDCLKDLNLSFSPPFSGVRDPVNVAGMVASNMRSGEYQVLHWNDFTQINLDTVSLIDVRPARDFKQRTIQGAINIPLEELRDRTQEIPRDKLAIVFCNYGKKGYFAHNILRQLGWSDVYNISGGLSVFQSETLIWTKTNAQDTELVEKTTKQARPPSKKSTAKIPASKPPELILDEVPVMDNPLFTEILNEESGIDVQLAEMPSLEDVIPILELDLTQTIELKPPLSNLPVVSDVITIEKTTSDIAVIEVDASGLNCPAPIMKLAKTMNKANAGDIVRIIATDSSFATDVKTWCEKKGHRLLEFNNSKAEISALLLKC